MNTFTLEDIAMAARHITQRPYDMVYPAALTYLHQVESIDQRTIEQDAIDEDTATFIIHAIKLADKVGDLGLPD